MTQQYLAGELSLILGELQTVATTDGAVRDIARLRREAETRPLTALTDVAARALELTGRWCWDSLMRGDPAAFARRAAIFVELSEFLDCARLVEHRHL
jgi:hypothetical protein